MQTSELQFTEKHNDDINLEDLRQALQEDLDEAKLNLENIKKEGRRCGQRRAARKAVFEAEAVMQAYKVKYDEEYSKQQASSRQRCCSRGVS